MAANFCFNFEIPEQNLDFSTKEQEAGRQEVKGFVKAEAKFINPNQKELEDVLKGNYEAKEVEITGLENGSSRLVHLSVAYVEKLIRNSEEYSTTACNQALKSNTDLIPSFYEGGLKIWECSIDLVNHLNKLFLENKLDFQDKAVLELGCGAGLPGIYACLKGARVCFQDYNSEVLKLFTIPNVALSMNSGNSFDFFKSPTCLENVKHCKFLSGDWELAKSFLEPNSFDVVLTSETIYNSDVQELLYELIKFTLNLNGVAFVAAKSYYFGVGGGTDQFSRLVKQDGAFDISNFTMCSEGVKREILVMKRK